MPCSRSCRGLNSCRSDLHCVNFCSKCFMQTYFFCLEGKRWDTSPGSCFCMLMLSWPLSSPLVPGYSGGAQPWQEVINPWSSTSTEHEDGSWSQETAIVCIYGKYCKSAPVCKCPDKLQKDVAASRPVSSSLLRNVLCLIMDLTANKDQSAASQILLRSYERILAECFLVLQ